MMMMAKLGMATADHAFVLLIFFCNHYVVPRTGSINKLLLRWRVSVTAASITAVNALRKPKMSFRRRIAKRSTMEAEDSSMPGDDPENQKSG